MVGAPQEAMHWAMQEQGFTNYSYECWHFDYGNQMYAMMLKFLGRDREQAAWYGYVPAPAAVTRIRDSDQGR